MLPFKTIKYYGLQLLALRNKSQESSDQTLIWLPNSLIWITSLQTATYYFLITESGV